MNESAAPEPGNSGTAAQQSHETLQQAGGVAAQTQDVPLKRRLNADSFRALTARLKKPESGSAPIGRKPSDTPEASEGPESVAEAIQQVSNVSEIATAPTQEPTADISPDASVGSNTDSTEPIEPLDAVEGKPVNLPDEADGTDAPVFQVTVIPDSTETVHSDSANSEAVHESANADIESTATEAPINIGSDFENRIAADDSNLAQVDQSPVTTCEGAAQPTEDTVIHQVFDETSVSDETPDNVETRSAMATGSGSLADIIGQIKAQISSGELVQRQKQEPKTLEEVPAFSTEGNGCTDFEPNPETDEVEATPAARIAAEELPNTLLPSQQAGETGLAGEITPIFNQFDETHVAAENESILPLGDAETANHASEDPATEAVLPTKDVAFETTDDVPDTVELQATNETTHNAPQTDAHVIEPMEAAPGLEELIAEFDRTPLAAVPQSEPEAVGVDLASGNLSNSSESDPTEFPLGHANDGESSENKIAVETAEQIELNGSEALELAIQNSNEPVSESQPVQSGEKAEPSDYNQTDAGTDQSHTSDDKSDAEDDLAAGLKAEDAAATEETVPATDATPLPDSEADLADSADVAIEHAVSIDEPAQPDTLESPALRLTQKIAEEFNATGKDSEAGSKARALLDYMADGSGQPHERALAADTLLRLITRVPLSDLKALAERICMMEEPPQLLLTRLINHPKIEVAGPLLENSKAISDQDLMQVINDAEHEKRVMIARRRSLSASLCDSLIETGDTAVCLTVIRNPGASLSHDAFVCLCDLARTNPNMQAPLATRGDTPAQIAFELFWSLPVELRRFVLSRYLTDSATLDKILKIAMNVDSGQATDQLDDPVFPHPDTLSAFSDAITAGQLDTAAKLLSEACAIAPETANRIVSDSLGEPLSVSYKAMGCSRAKFSEIMKKVQESDHSPLKKDRDLEEIQAVFDSLSFNKARVLLTYWDWATNQTGPYARLAA